MAAESDTLCEIEVLQSIYLDELNVTRNDDGGWQVSLVLHPSTGEDCLSQFVRLTLTLDLDSEYPSSPPCISIHNPRGLSDDKLLSLQQSLQIEAESCLGMPVLYQLIEKAKEILTESNIPHGNCVICLYGFKLPFLRLEGFFSGQEGEVFTKTNCYHYFHSHCLGRYITHSEVELRERERELEEDKTRDRAEEELSVVCPVCRESLSYDVNALLSSPAPDFPQQEDEAVGAEFKRKWESLQKILEHQKEKGGVIDPEVESNRFLIHINETPVDSDSTCSDATNPESSRPLPAVPPECPSQTPAPQAQHSSHHSHRRAPHYRRQHGEFRGGRRGRGRGGGRNEPPFQGIPAPVVENLTKLNISSAESSQNHIQNSLLPQNNDLPAESTEQGHSLEPKANSGQTSTFRKTAGEICVGTCHQDTLAEGHEQQTSQTNLNITEDSTQPIVTDGQQQRVPRDRGRRHGPRGPPYGQWHERIPRGDGGGNAYRGGRGHRARGGGFSHHHHRGGGPYRGTGKVMHPKTETEFKKEGVL
ncbi:E3 ubiquitin-protein ligase RNF25 isoform X2 [Astyanax mexicanus]|uniref:E3 ubiquitin-protein ligase RNF25 isoform X2 n=1 Tax=Astyanax mexicanus TaxID=7994 RepID=UPI000BBDC294|nr:E3 ubiquitin-protein ligase RNF25 isoform X2 [Astyanax mexicanus]